MQSRLIMENTRQDSVLASNKVLRNTYFLLALTLSFLLWLPILQCIWMLLHCI